MLILIALIAVVTARVANRAGTQRDVVVAIRNLHGVVIYDFKYSDGKEIFNGQPRGPAWLQRWVGLDHLHSVTKVVFFGAKTKDVVPFMSQLSGLEAFVNRQAHLTKDDLIELSGMPVLQDLDLAYSDLDDQGIMILAGLPNLRKLNVSGTRITDRSIGLLARSRNLEDLDLFGTELTKKGIGLLKEIPSLRRVRLRNITTEEVVAGLRDATRLQSLEMDYEPNVEDWDTGGRASLMKCLRSLPQLRELKIHGFIDDDILLEIAKLDRLEELDLNLTVITDTGLNHLQALTHLRKLDVSFTNVTVNGIKTLQDSKPNLVVRHK